VTGPQLLKLESFASGSCSNNIEIDEALIEDSISFLIISKSCKAIIRLLFPGISKETKELEQRIISSYLESLFKCITNPFLYFFDNQEVMQRNHWTPMEKVQYHIPYWKIVSSV
jgi:hypothetical protein